MNTQCDTQVIARGGAWASCKSHSQRAALCDHHRVQATDPCLGFRTLLNAKQPINQQPRS